jgi:hypothetical protein
LQADDINKGKENTEGMELNQGEAKPSDCLDGGNDKSEKKTEDIIQCESEMTHRDMVRGMLNGIVDTVVQGMLLS